MVKTQEAITIILAGADRNWSATAISGLHSVTQLRFNTTAESPIASALLRGQDIIKSVI